MGDRSKKEPMPCHFIQDGDDWVHIPGCWGAIHDPLCCTCKIAGSPLERAEKGRAVAERYIETLRDRDGERIERCNSLFRENRKLRARIT